MAMLIRQFKKICDHGIFRDFSWPTTLSDFARYNLIYGWNGSGKTTLSRLLRNLEFKTSPSSGRISIRVNQDDLDGSNFSNTKIPVRVFNQEFVTESVFPIGGGDVSPIFVLGKESVEKQKKINNLKISLEKLREELASTTRQKDKAENDLDKFFVDQAKKIKEILRSSGENNYNNYNKSHFMQRVRELSKFEDPSKHKINELEINKLLAQHRSSPKKQINLVSYEFPNIEKVSREINSLLSTTVVSKVVETLKSDTSLSSWVHQGLKLHKERSEKQCLFCEQVIKKERVQTLEDHFSTEFENFLNKVKTKIREIKHELESIKNLKFPISDQFYEDIVPKFESAQLEFQHELNKIKKLFEQFLVLLEEKESHVFGSFDEKSFDILFDTKKLDQINELIRGHNQTCNEFQERVSSARKRIENHHVSCNLEEYDTLRNTVELNKQKLETLTHKLEKLNLEITTLEREIVEHQRPAEELNQELCGYLGHNELQLEIKDSGYSITRFGKQAKALSEGEKTAFAILYFLKSLNDRKFNFANGVVVLDDPISSLDSNSLYSAFAYIREKTQEAGQLFIFTHNFTFFRQVRNWFHNIEGQKKKDASKRPSRFYMLNCLHNQNGRFSEIRWLDPLLEQFDSEYHYLFSYIYKAAMVDAPADLGKNYVLPNMARRLLESFLAFRQPQMSGNLRETLKLLTFDNAKKIRILRFLHTHSHNNIIGAPEHDLSILGEGQPVLKDLLELIKSEDEMHYCSMESLISDSEINKNENIPDISTRTISAG